METPTKFYLMNGPLYADDLQGNVLTVVSDIKIPLSTDGITVDSYRVGIRNISDYSPFGVLLAERTVERAFYRNGLQGQEHDDEVKGDGNSVNFSYRMHDPRVGRFFAVDPLAAKFSYNSTYSFSENDVINSVEIEGLEKLELSLVGDYQNNKITPSTQSAIAVVMSYDLNTDILEITVLVGNNVSNPTQGVQLQINTVTGNYYVNTSTNTFLPSRYVLPSIAVPIGPALTETLDFLEIFSGLTDILLSYPEFKEKASELGISSSFITGTFKSISDFLEKASDKGLVDYGLVQFDSPNVIKEIPGSIGPELAEYDGGTVSGIENKNPIRAVLGDDKIVFKIEQLKLQYTDQTRIYPKLELQPNYKPTTRDQDGLDPNNFTNDYIPALPSVKKNLN